MENNSEEQQKSSIFDKFKSWKANLQNEEYRNQTIKLARNGLLFAGAIFAMRKYGHYLEKILSKPFKIKVESAGVLCGNYARIYVNSIDYSQNTRGLNFVVIDPKESIIWDSVSYDTFDGVGDYLHMIKFIDSIPEGFIVLAAVKDEASARVHEEGINALRKIGAKDYNPGFRGSWAIIGIKGAKPDYILQKTGNQQTPVKIENKISLQEDFQKYYQNQQNCDTSFSLLNGSTMAHSKIIEMRIGNDSFIKLKEASPNIEKENFDIFMNWIYSGEIQNQDIIEGICDKIGINEINEKIKEKVYFEDFSNWYKQDNSKDFSIFVENEKVLVHKDMIFSRCELFRGMFLSVNDQTPQVSDYSSRSKESISEFMKFLYTNEIDQNLSKEIYEELTDAHDYYGLSENSGFQFELERIHLLNLPSKPIQKPEKTKLLKPFNIQVESAGLLCGNYARIYVNSIDYSRNTRGLNFVIIDPETKVIWDSVAFDVHGSEPSIRNMIKFIDSIPEGFIVLAAVKDEATNRMNYEGRNSLAKIGAKDYNPGYRGSWAIIGRKGAKSRKVLQKNGNQHPVKLSQKFD
ncbi:hypothetical protein M0811_06667 [Anaeramoeba ignava]|uniref:BTB domain-containing protein n=1 Tax=Anaeramoeba ignava TaxID=1746090 RepID=A0A9Q0LNL2_ANAIG|nr:hypothetical protein M0811_06667 [Anaeramoeba ignava]